MADTITAISTPPGEGGIGIVRVSGPLAEKIMRGVFSACPDKIKPRHAYYGKVTEKDGTEIDEAIFILMKAPHTYTCEDVFEIQAHGGTVSMRKILRRTVEEGARLAEPGEFTKLAFLNGRIDLTQAEAVIDIIKAKSELPHDVAVKQLAGTLADDVSDIRDLIKDALAQMAVNIDFPDEDIEQEEYEKLIGELSLVLERVRALIKTSGIGRIAKEGIKVAIAGRPNVGKSSLMNAMLGEKRVIVTDVPGTTRDTIEELANVAGVPVVLIDTAGIRDTDDEVERIGIERSNEELEKADIILLVLDASEALTKEDGDLLSKLDGKKVLVIMNKKDKGVIIEGAKIEQSLKNTPILYTSLTVPELRNESVRDVVKAMEDIVLGGDVSAENAAIVANERQLDALKRAEQSLCDAIDLLRLGNPLEIAELDAHMAYDALGEIVGETSGEEILDAVFSKFCLGK